MGVVAVEFDPRHEIVVCTLEGDVVAADADYSRGEVVRLLKTHQCSAVLVDIRDSNSTLSLMEVFRQADETSAAFASVDLKYQQVKRAIVANEPGGDASFYETVASNRGHNVRLFLDVDEAIAWLKGTPTAPEPSAESEPGRQQPPRPGGPSTGESR